LQLFFFSLQPPWFLLGRSLNKRKKNICLNTDQGGTKEKLRRNAAGSPGKFSIDLIDPISNQYPNRKKHEEMHKKRKKIAIYNLQIATAV